VPKITIPQKHTDTQKELSSEMREYYFAYMVLNSIQHIDFTFSSILQKCTKKAEVKSPKTHLTPKQVSLLAWVYVFNERGIDTYNTPTLCEYIEKAQGVKFIQNPHDLSVWFQNIGDKVIRDKEKKKTLLCDTYQKLLDYCNQKGSFELIINKP
jgi:hypothetical protein